ncbi:hypothetical protein [Labedaea rhizosphaerae]|uniref:Uncharacterized protein n=1 Tax=Labedaea rhizosphaerae TaxID=598644 RepID=A0A4R6SMC6_LABRH|nr:hypothetical protein [Labedaea rhizosphaerae]TDQ05064.1 hypothetical protein EV186_1011028 [Labedaea rhizosphaerae]
MNQHAEHEVPAVEPAGDAPAAADPATEWALRALRASVLAPAILSMIAIVVAIAVGLAGVAEVFVLVIAFAGVLGLSAGAPVTLRWLHWRGPVRTLLDTQPWRPADVSVFRPARGRTPGCRLRVLDASGEPVWLSVVGLGWSGQQVLARTGRAWLVGPDAEGNAAIRSSGLAVPIAMAQVGAQQPTDVIVEAAQRAPRRAPKARDDVVVANLLAGPRRRSRTDLVAPVLLLVLAVFVLVAVLRSNHAVPRYGEMLGWALAILAVLVAFAGWRIARLLRTSRIDRMLAAGPWRAVPVDLDGEPDPRNPQLRGNATLPGGGTVAVSVPKAGFVLTANVAATGLLWVVGEPAAGRRTVAGLPGYPLLAVATFTA